MNRINTRPYLSPLAITLAISLLTVVILAACAPPAISTNQARVFFVEPKDGGVVSSPVSVRMGAENFVVEPSGEVHEGAGHLHIMVDVPCSKAGEVVTKDDNHLHYGGGQMDAELELATGKHTLCLQAADGVHIALDGSGMTDPISIEVE